MLTKDQGMTLYFTVLILVVLLGVGITIASVI